MKEVKFAQSVYQSSLSFDDIYVSPLLGIGGREFTMALKLSVGRWVVVLNLGSVLFANPGSDGSTLIHELAHAWQSQHHHDPAQFMVNSAKSQAAAQIATALSTRPAKIAVRSLGVPDVSNGPASAYAYVPKQAFGNYGAEQIAQQVEDFNFPPAGMGPIVRTQLAPIITHMSALAPGTSDAANVLGLSAARFEFENTPGVVWHAQ